MSRDGTRQGPKVSTLNHPVFLISHGDFSNLNDTYGYERGAWTIFAKRDFLHLSAAAAELCGEWFGFCFCRFWCSSSVTKNRQLKKDLVAAAEERCIGSVGTEGYKKAFAVSWFSINYLLCFTPPRSWHSQENPGAVTVLFARF